MGRLTDKLSAALEATEGDMAMLGNSLVYIRLVIERIQAVQAVVPQQYLLAPGIDDLTYAYRLIRTVQERLSDRERSSPRAPVTSESSSEKTHNIHQTAPNVGGCTKKGLGS